jgi:hypothetical protein
LKKKTGDRIQESEFRSQEPGARSYRSSGVAGVQKSGARRTTRNVNKVFRSQASLRDFSERMGFSHSVTPVTPEF